MISGGPIVRVFVIIHIILLAIYIEIICYLLLLFINIIILNY